ncbi:VOC family protein [Jongsikchunia kroppenstedtii]|uniref:VOC family protein n=1 Tax=Jongsikchunia kroppenstedtii TaxID=1121721 RepID=UPI000380CD71|nr:VOC family protein [Jongsikchunia kroppenstedtii]
MKIATTQLWVHDQDAALEFYTKKLGFEVREDVRLEEMPGFRWLTVAPPGQDDISIVLMSIPGEPMLTPDGQKEILNLVGKGFAGAVFLTTDDVYADYDRLAAAGVEFTDKPEQRPYGIDCGLRDPSGNTLRLTQLTDF